MAIPSLTETLDDTFLSTWYEIRTEAIDNILDATVMWLAMREFGVLTPKVGGRYIDRTILYGTKSKQNISRGSTLQQSVKKLETMAMWEWSYTAVDINRSYIDDQQNSGPDQIKDYVATRIEAARNALIQDLEGDLFKWAAYATDQMNGIWDIMPPSTSIPAAAAYGGIATGAATSSSNDDATDTFGGIARSNSWWQNLTQAGTLPSSVNLLSDMRTAWNTVSANIANPNFIICDQDLYEYYEDEVSDRQQIVRTAFSEIAADLGFETKTFKGAPISWTAKMSVSDKMLMINFDFVELVYDPNSWFDMTPWMDTPNQLERVAYIINSHQLIGTQPRRQLVLDYNSTTKT